MHCSQAMHPRYYVVFILTLVKIIDDDDDTYIIYIYLVLLKYCSLFAYSDVVKAVLEQNGLSDISMKQFDAIIPQCLAFLVLH